MKLNLKPLDDRVIVRAAESEDKTVGGILLPDNAKEKQQKGSVVAVGPGKLLDSGERGTLSVKVGDTILFGKYAGNDVKVNGEELKIMRESDILAKVE